MDREEPQLKHTVADGVATVVISHPAKRNAMTAAMWQALPALLERLAADPAVRALVLTGAGDTFCAGADISSLRDRVSDPDYDPQALAVGGRGGVAARPPPPRPPRRALCVGGGWRRGPRPPER
ncbi:enoyl-CoA hydratase/isomerase family protein, partial [Streptomyces sp. NPDC059744]|uniref:enoyl-CoA hydratase/isomerase family protein n=1 Tax=Streptomyces sp. NPDC059744 TaxID=3346929 RepID=UPI00364F0BF0